MWVNPKGGRSKPPPSPAPEPSGRLLATFERPGRGRGPDTELRVSLDEYMGHPFINMRVWSRGSDGNWYPTRKGLSVKLREAENLAETLGEAVRLAGIDEDQAAKGSPRRDDRHQRSMPNPPRSASPRPTAPTSGQRETPTPPCDSQFDEFGSS